MYSWIGTYCVDIMKFSKKELIKLPMLPINVSNEVREEYVLLFRLRIHVFISFTHNFSTFHIGLFLHLYSGDCGTG